MIEALIDGGCNINKFVILPESAIDQMYSWYKALGAVCLRYQFDERKEESELDIAKVLIRNGAQIDTSVNIDDESTSDSPPYQGVPLIEFCVRYGSAKWVRFLLAHGATRTSESGLSLEDYAAIRQDAEIIQILNDYGYSTSQAIVKSSSSVVEGGATAVGEMLMSASGGVGASLRPRHWVTLPDL